MSNPRWNNPNSALVSDGSLGTVLTPGGPAPPAGPLAVGVGFEVPHTHGPTRNGVPYKAPATGGDDGHGRDSWRNSGGAPAGAAPPGAFHHHDRHHGGGAMPLSAGHEQGAVTPMQRGGGLVMGAAAAAAAAAAGEAKLSSSGLLLDRTGAFLSAGDYLMDGPHGHHHHLGHTPPLGAGGLGGVPMHPLHGAHHHHVSHHLADPHDNSHFLHNLPRNFSLSDLSVEMAAQLNGDVAEGVHGGAGLHGPLGSLAGLDTPGGGWDAPHPLINGGSAAHHR